MAQTISLARVEGLDAHSVVAERELHAGLGQDMKGGILCILAVDVRRISSGFNFETKNTHSFTPHIKRRVLLL